MRRGRRLCCAPWSDPPVGTRALALIVDYPDAPVGTCTHWLAWHRALDAVPKVGARAGRRELERMLAGHVFATAVLMGTHER